MKSHPFDGYLLAIEGIDGAGKTTQAHHVQDRLQAGKVPVIRTKEPTTGQWGQILRDSALTGRLSAEEEFETFLKDRREHVDTLLAPELRSGKVVIVDRYYFSSMAYQGARGIDPAEIQRRNEEFAPEPDLLVLLDIEPEAGLERVRMRGDRANLFEQTRALARAREIFQSIDQPYLLRLDARQPVEVTCDAIVKRFQAVVAARIAASEKVSEPLRTFARA